MAVFKGMHVSPAKHNDEKGVKMTSRKWDYRTDTQADRQADIGRSCSYVPLCFAGKAIKVACTSGPFFEKFIKRYPMPYFLYR